MGTHSLHIKKENCQVILVFAETPDRRQMASFTSMKRSRRCCKSGEMDETTTEFSPATA